MANLAASEGGCRVCPSCGYNDFENSRSLDRKRSTGARKGGGRPAGGKKRKKAAQNTAQPKPDNDATVS